MPPSSPRLDALRQFATNAFAEPPLSIESASADASFRSYWRVTTRAGATRIVMDAPPDKEDLGPWLDIGARLRHAGLHAPEVFALDRAQGFVLMEDLGARTYLPALNDATVDGLYGDALAALARMQTQVDASELPAYDRARLMLEMELLPEWFLKRHLGFTPSRDEWNVIEAAFTLLLRAALEQPRVFVHRDFHSRNLLIVDSGIAASSGSKLLSPGIIDFQDGVLGPITYDLVSLLRDCYIEWLPVRVDGWVENAHRHLHEAKLIEPSVDAGRFRRWFDLMGLQRHIKVLGIFCRLWYRDGKEQYLADLPLVWHYLISVARRYPEFAGFVALMERAGDGRDITQPRNGEATS